MEVMIVDLRHAERHKNARPGEDKQALTDCGVGASQEVRRILKARGFGNPGRIVASMIGRTHNTAQAVFGRGPDAQLPELNDLKGIPLGPELMPATEQHAAKHGLIQALFCGPKEAELRDWGLYTLDAIVQEAGRCPEVDGRRILAVVSHGWMVELRAGLLIHMEERGQFPTAGSLATPSHRCHELGYSEGYCFTVEIEPSTAGYQLTAVYATSAIFLPARFKRTQ